LYPYRPAGGGEGPAAPLPGGRGQDVIKIYVLSHGGPYRPAGGLPPGRWAAGSHPQYKSRGPPSRFPTPIFAANNIHRGKKERRGVREGVVTAKPCQILDPNRR